MSEIAAGSVFEFPYPFVHDERDFNAYPVDAQRSQIMTDFAWLVEAPGQNYLAARKLGVHEFCWTKEHEKALRFMSQEQADLTMMAVRELNPALFGFAATLGDARPVEHGWG